MQNCHFSPSTTFASKLGTPYPVLKGQNFFEVGGSNEWDATHVAQGDSSPNLRGWYVHIYLYASGWVTLVRYTWFFSRGTIVLQYWLLLVSSFFM